MRSVAWYHKQFKDEKYHKFFENLLGIYINFETNFPTKYDCVTYDVLTEIDFYRLQIYKSKIIVYPTKKFMIYA